MNWALIILSFQLGGWFSGPQHPMPERTVVALYDTKDLCRNAQERLEKDLPTTQKIICGEVNQEEAKEEKHSLGYYYTCTQNGVCHVN